MICDSQGRNKEERKVGAILQGDVDAWAHAHQLPNPGKHVPLGAGRSKSVYNEIVRKTKRRSPSHVSLHLKGDWR